MISRRRFLQSSALVLAACGSTTQRVHVHSARTSTAERLDELERKVGGRVGVMALDTATGARVAHRASERFAMCSTFKWVLAAYVLSRVDRGELDLQEPIAYSKPDLLDYSPVTLAHAGEGRLPLVALCAAAVEESDNTAANLLLRRTGGPAALTAWLRSIGDTTTRLDRNEPALNSNVENDPRDTTTPEATVMTLQHVLLGNVLRDDSRPRLLDFMKNCRTGAKRLHAGLPLGWPIGQKTGTGERGAVNDVGIVWPPARAPILIAAYLSDSSAELDVLEAAHATIAEILVERLAEGHAQYR